MNSVVEQQDCLFAELYHQIFLTNTVTTEQLWLQCSHDQYVENQWKKGFPMQRSEASKQNLFG